jgi:hypothetical protein
MTKEEIMLKLLEEIPDWDSLDYLQRINRIQMLGITDTIFK